MQFTITQAGLLAAANAQAGGPKITLTSFKAGSSVNYIPSINDIALRGTILHTQLINGYSVLSANEVEYTLIMNEEVGDFEFGEIGLYMDDGTLFALGSLEQLQAKTLSDQTDSGNIISIDARLVLTQIAANISFPINSMPNARLLETPTVDLLRPPVVSDTNAYLTMSKDSGGSSIPAFKSADFEWSFPSFTRVLSAAISANGKNYTTAGVSFSGGSPTRPATANATIVAGAVQSVTLTDAGAGYATVPTVAITGDGVGAEVTCTITQGVTALAVINAGAGYSSAPTVVISGGGGTGATATASISGGTVTGFTITAPGSGYTSNPTVNLTGGGGAGATASATISGTVNNLKVRTNSTQSMMCADLSDQAASPLPGKYILEFISGPLAGYCRMVTASTPFGTQWSVGSPMGTAPAPGDTFALWTSNASILGADQNTQPPAYSTSKAYKAGKVVAYQFNLWRCITDTPSGSFNAAHWTRILGTAAEKTAQTTVYDSTAGSLMQVGAFGLGGQVYALSSTDANLWSTVSGMYAILGSDIASPGGVATTGYLDHKRASVSAVQSFTVVPTVGQPPRIFTRSGSASGWSAWTEVWLGNSLIKQTSALDYTDGSVLRMFGSGSGPFGIGGVAGNLTDVNSLTYSGFGRVAGLNTPNAPTLGAGSGIGMPHSLGLDNLGGQLFLNYTTDMGNYTTTPRLFARSKSAVGVWAAWTEFWNTNNLVKQTSATDNTAGRMMAVGAFGLGSVGLISASGDCNTHALSGFYRIAGAVTNGPYVGSDLILHVTGGVDIVAQTAWRYQTGEMWTRTRTSTTWGVWNELWTTKNLVKQVSKVDATAGSMLEVGSFGLGSGSLPNIGNMDLLAIPTGWYRWTNGVDTGTAPTGAAANGIVLVEWFSSQVCRQTFSSVNGSNLVNNDQWVRQINITQGIDVWSRVWNEKSLIKQTSLTDQTAGRMLEVGSFGLGHAVLLSDFNLAKNGFSMLAHTATNGPIASPPSGQYWTQTQDAPLSTTGRLQDVHFRSADETIQRKFFRTYNGTTWSVWIEQASGYYKGFGSISTRILVSTDLGRMHQPSDNSTITLPTPASIGAQNGATFHLWMGSRVACTVVAGAGATLSLDTTNQTVNLRKGQYMTFVATDSTGWIALGTGGLGTNGDFASSLGLIGYKKIPDATSPSGFFIHQWGYYEGPLYLATYPVNLTFPIAFPTMSVSLQASIGITVYDYDIDPSYRSAKQSISVGRPSTTGIEMQAFIDTDNASTRRTHWYAIGY